MNVTGYYGKLPQRGDFISGKLPETFKTIWDDWAQQLVLVGKTVAQENSAINWYCLPIYRFYLSAKIAGDNAWIGIMMPSSDSVGREYPFCLAHSIDSSRHAPQAFEIYQNYFQQIELIAKDLCTNELSLEHLRKTLDALDNETSSTVAASAAPIVIQPQAQEPELSVRLVDIDNNPGQIPRWDMASAAILSGTCSAHSIWVTSPISNSTQETLICEAMPTQSNSASLFSGIYAPSQWTQLSESNNKNEYREENRFSISAASEIDNRHPENSDTIPIQKSRLAQPGQTDILDFDDQVSPDAPWEH